MKKFCITIAVLLAATNIFANDGFFETIKNTSTKNEKTLLIFYKTDCQFCKKMDEAITTNINFTNELVKKYTVQVLDITTPQGRLMANKFNIHAVPSIVNYNNNTAEVTIIKGFANTQKLALALGLPSNIYDANNTNNTSLAACGDGVVDGGEQCDDGNVTNGDGCSATCTIQAGYACTGNPSVCAGICGDGIIAGAEQCDDGNVVNGDGCNNICLTEAAPPNDECNTALAIGNTAGTISSSNAFATNSTAPSCASTLKDMWYSFTIVGTKNYIIKLNGIGMADAVLNLYSGTCATLVTVKCNDDYNGTSSQIQGTLTAGTYIIRVGSFGSTVAGTFNLVYNFNAQNVCGNNIVELTEECDDGNTNNNDGCSNNCAFEDEASIVGVSINRDSTRANPSAILDVKSLDKGLLVPRMTTMQKNAIAAPAKGLLVFDVTTNTFWFYNGIAWAEVGNAGSTGATGSGLPAGTTSQTLRNNGTVWVANSALQNDGTNVTVTGQIKINGGTPAVGKVLTADNTGLATWQTPGIGNAAFSVRLDSNRTLVQGAGDIRLHFGNYGSSVGNFLSATGFNPTTDEFVAPSAGLYVFTLDIYLLPLATDFNISSQIRVDNSSNAVVSQVSFIDYSSAGTLNSSHGHTAIFNLNTGDKVYVLASKFNGAGTANITVSNGFGGIATTRFTGYKIN